MPTPTLIRLVDENLRRAPEYAGGLTNHLPMALHALRSLGADDSELDRFAAAYVQRKRLSPLAGEDTTPSGAPPRLGDFGAFAAWRAHFAARVSALGARGALVESLPDLWPGVAAAAFHGPIRVAHAWEMGHHGELAAALAYWAARWQPIEVRHERAPALDLDDWLAAAEAAARSRGDGQALISPRMDAASRTPGFLRFAGHLRATEDALGRAARWAAGLYAETGNFTILHVVTGSRALRLLSPLSAPPPQVWHALAAAIVASGIGPRSPLPASDLSWDQVVDAARSSQDDHVVKLVHACSQLSASIPGDEFLAAARRAVGPS